MEKQCTSSVSFVCIFFVQDQTLAVCKQFVLETYCLLLCKACLRIFRCTGFKTSEKDCSRLLSHHSLLHVPWMTPPEVNESEKNADQSLPATMDLPLNSATLEDSKRSFVLLKVVPPCVAAENGTVVSTYGRFTMVGC